MDEQATEQHSKEAQPEDPGYSELTVNSKVRFADRSEHKPLHIVHEFDRTIEHNTKEHGKATCTCTLL